MGDGHVHSSGTEGWSAMLLGIVLAVAAVVSIVSVVRFILQPQTEGAEAAPSMPGTSAARSPESPQTILKRRYAAGEIDRDVYLQILEELDRP